MKGTTAVPTSSPTVTSNLGLFSSHSFSQDEFTSLCFCTFNQAFIMQLSIDTTHNK